MASEAHKAIEAILMVAQEPVDPHLLAQVLEVSPTVVEELCTELADGYQAQDRGFVLVKVAGGYRFQSAGELSAYVERFVLEGQSARLSAAALETLAIVAYKQPMSRAQVAAIRGVNVEGVMRTLQQRGYIEEVGRDSGPGQATLFGTSQEFLERLGLASIGDLPPIADLFPSAEIMEALEKGLRADRLEPLPLDAGPDDEPAPSQQPPSPAPPTFSAIDWSEPETTVEPLPEPGFMAEAAATDGGRAEPEIDLTAEPGTEPGADATTTEDGAEATVDLTAEATGEGGSAAGTGDEP
ncbi:MAG: scpB [Acidimicrobiales bacterium]|nr:scpB [Acidimicrobiales bacterium]